MQPTAVITSPAVGLVYINGRLAGETAPESPLIIPITPNGTVYIELIPFGRIFRPCAYRLPVKNGVPNTENTDNSMTLMLYPNGVIETSLRPPKAFTADSEFTVTDGIPITLQHGEASLLKAGNSSAALPGGASLPDSHMTLNGNELFLGNIPGGKYLAVFDKDTLIPKGSITADSISTENSTVHTETALNDTAGHIRIDEYSIYTDGIGLISSQIHLPSPKHPTNAEEAAMAAMEALLLGLSEEARQYTAGSIAAITEGIDAVIPLKYAVPTTLPAIGLVRRLSEHCASVEPLYYKAKLSEDGKWKIIGFRK